ncbi:TPA: hypothetical protein DEG21_02335 [Patescibacteria group bacterium]|nr:hypothetical protein [Candidatus Gracilibacteria bacterium]
MVLFSSKSKPPSSSIIFLLNKIADHQIKEIFFIHKFNLFLFTIPTILQFISEAKLATEILIILLFFLCSLGVFEILFINFDLLFL